MARDRGQSKSDHRQKSDNRDKKPKDKPNDSRDKKPQASSKPQKKEAKVNVAEAKTPVELCLEDREKEDEPNTQESHGVWAVSQSSIQACVTRVSG